MKPKTILIVEDEIIVSADLANMLHKLGYEVIGSTDCGEEAIDLAKTLHPDLVLMDIFLAGEMDGVAAAEVIFRQHDLPVVFLTAHSDRTTLDRAKHSEPFGYVIKPFDKAELEIQIEIALHKHLTERKLRASEEKLRQTNSKLEFLVQQRTSELQRTNQALRMLSACNEAVIRMEDEQTLMQEVCRIAVDIGGYRMAWVGMAVDDADQSVRPVAYTGFEEGYLESARISWGNNERGLGPTGMAIRTGQVQISQDFHTDPRLAPWREEALSRGFFRSIVLPLCEEAAVIGALTIYNSEPADFSEAQIKVLTDLMTDLAFGLASLRMRTHVREGRDLLRTLASELTLAEQRERRRLASFLHDNLQQLLVAARFRTGILCRSEEEKTRQAAREIEKLLLDSITASRSMTYELSPPILQKGGLAAGLEWLAGWMADKHELCVQLTLEPVLLPEAEDVNVLVFESVRELLFNIVKHAHTQSAMVTMRQENEDCLQIVVADNGVGFEQDQALPTVRGTGFGLFSIRERLDLLGGQLDIATSPGKGSRFTITTPLVKAGAGTLAAQSC